jgi:hypothetical protein
VRERAGSRALAVALVPAQAAGCATSEYMGRVLTPEDEACIRRANPVSDVEVVVTPLGTPERGRIVRVEPTTTAVELADRDVLVANETIKEIRAR